jgi:hypothetical protein
MSMIQSTQHSIQSPEIVGALPPWAQEEREKEAIRNILEPTWVVQDIQGKVGGPYTVTIHDRWNPTTYEVQVKVHPLPTPSDSLGPTLFSLEFIFPEISGYHSFPDCDRPQG